MTKRGRLVRAPICLVAGPLVHPAVTTKAITPAVAVLPLDTAQGSRKTIPRYELGDGAPRRRTVRLGRPGNRATLQRTTRESAIGRRVGVRWDLASSSFVDRRSDVVLWQATSVYRDLY